MKRLIPVLLLLFCPLTQATVTNLTPAQVHDRLVAGDNVLLVDVREVSEYATGHLAEPTGYLPLTPANLPYTTHVIDSQYYRLPKDIDIIVTCGSGVRSAKASDSLLKWGFARIYNMTGGFSQWTSAGYESRTGGFGDHSGAWVRIFQSSVATIAGSGVADSSSLALTAQILPAGLDSAYFELHAAWGKQPIPAALPASDVHGLYRVTALDPYGMPLFVNDSITSMGNVTLRCGPSFPVGVTASSAVANPRFAVSNGQGQWIEHAAVLNFPIYSLTEKSLHRWYATVGSLVSSVTRGIPAGAAVRRLSHGARGIVTAVDGKIIASGGRGVLVRAGGRAQLTTRSRP